MENILTTTENLCWKCNSSGLINEILKNKECAILYRPLQIFAAILAEVGERAAEINDPKLNALMCRLAIYSISDPYNPEFDKEKTERIISQFY